jgi:hypothetical protein
MDGNDGAWSISVSRNLWPNIGVASERVVARPKRCGAMGELEAELVSIMWDDGEQVNRAR